MIAGLTWLLLCQVLGELLVRTTGLPVPGPVAGMVLLFVFLQLRRPPDSAGVLRAGDVLLKHLQLLFVPAGVGVVVYLATLRDNALPLAVGLLGSWLLGLVTVGLLVQALARLRGQHSHHAHPQGEAS